MYLFKRGRKTGLQLVTTHAVMVTWKEAVAQTSLYAAVERHCLIWKFVFVPISEIRVLLRVRVVPLRDKNALPLGKSW